MKHVLEPINFSSYVLYSDIKRVCRRARGTCEHFAHLYHRKNLESKRVSLSVKTATTERIMSALQTFVPP